MKQEELKKELPGCYGECGHHDPPSAARDRSSRRLKNKNENNKQVDYNSQQTYLSIGVILLGYWSQISSHIEVGLGVKDNLVHICIGRDPIKDQIA